MKPPGGDTVDRMSVSTLITLALAALTALIGGWVGLFRYTVATKEADFERRLSEQKTAVMEVMKAIADAKDEDADLRQAVTKLEGRFDLVDERYTTLKAGVEHIKDTMVPQAVWEQRMSNMEKVLNRVLDELSTIGKQRTMSQQFPGVKR